jgi:hypothetical protein
VLRRPVYIWEGRTRKDGQKETKSEIEKEVRTPDFWDGQTEKTSSRDRRPASQRKETDSRQPEKRDNQTNLDGRTDQTEGQRKKQ